jgi:hypothetical protein
VETKEAEKFLINTQYEKFIGYFQEVELKNYLYKNLFKIGNEALGYFALKIRDVGQKNVMDSIEILSALKDPENIVNKNIDKIVRDGYIIMISDWLDGIQPIDGNREYPPLFYSKLAYINKRNISDGPFTSMYSDGKYFETIGALVDYETGYHKEYLYDLKNLKEIMEVLQNLKNGLACIIMEDMHPGNLFITNDKHYKFIDTEWMIRGINLYQFEKIDYFGFEEKAWYTITDEANEQIRAFELLQVLRKNIYLKFCDGQNDHGQNGPGNNDKEIERRIVEIIKKEKFI